ncbi:hypothetical protein K9L97_03775 [Candidatus Woesearchaeota archaeon]|nr:hypothetical protein [Candidatus Woesearchaeota archaeon]
MVDDDNPVSLVEKLKILQSKENQKKKEFEKLKKELEEDSEKIKEKIAETVREIEKEEIEKFLEDEKKRKKPKSLDENITQNIDEMSNIIISQGEYNSLEKKNLYDVANRDFYGKVKNLMEKADAGYITQSEKNFLSKVSYKISQIRAEESYITKKDPRSYLSRMESLLNAVKK